MNKPVQTIIHHNDNAVSFVPAVSFPEMSYLMGHTPAHAPLPVPKIIAIRLAICEAWAIADSMRADLRELEKLMTG